MPRTDLYGESVFHVRIVSNIVNGFFGVVAVPRNLRVPPVVVPPVVVPPEAGVVPPEAGVVPPEAGVVPPEAGVVPPEAAGVVPPEAGVVPPEAAGVVVILPPIFFAMQVEGV